jgi:hypothetical protein
MAGSAGLSNAFARDELKENARWKCLQQDQHPLIRRSSDRAPS